MRSAVFAMLSLGLLGACETNTKIDPVTVQWMDWPAEVNAGQPFRTRLVVWNVCAINPQFRSGASANDAAVTFAPSFISENDRIMCAQATGDFFAVAALDTAGIAPGLRAASPRSYEMRAPTLYFAFSTAAQGLSVGTFGEVLVRPSGADPSRRNAAGYVNVEHDSLNCARVRPMGLYAPKAALVLEDQADTTRSATFMTGYIHTVTVPVCGETQVFHRVAGN